MVTIKLFGQPSFMADTEVAKANEVADLLTREVKRFRSANRPIHLYSQINDFNSRCAEYCQPHRSVEKILAILWTKWQSDARR
jgi:hypothetical protein